MDIYLSIRWNGNIDENLASQLNKEPHVECQEQQTTIGGLFEANWRDVLQKIKESGLRLASPTSFGLLLLTSTDSLIAEDATAAGVVAYVIEGDGTRNEEINPPEDRRYQLRPPCESPISHDRPLELKYKPKGVVEQLPSQELIYSRRFLDAIDAHPDDFGGEIRHKGVALTNWSRGLGTSTVEYLAPELFRCRLACVVCGSPYVSACGVWVAKDTVGLDASYAFDACGLYHYGSVFPLIVSRRTADFVLSRYTSFADHFAPVFTRECGIAKLARECITELMQGENLSAEPPAS